MKRIPPAPLRAIAESVFAAAGCEAREAVIVAKRLVEANLTGHDSHGVVRVPSYVRWLGEGKIAKGAHATLVHAAGAVVVVDGGFGFGQVVGGEAIEIGLKHAHEHGAAILGLRNAHHLGRIGDWAEQCAAAGFASIHFVNVVGTGGLVAPFGGVERRMSTNPFACSLPMGPDGMVVLDVATSFVAEGKVMVAKNKGVATPAGALLDAEGRDSVDPNALYGPPVGALNPFGDHKGSGLALFCDLLAGALTGGGCNHDGHPNVRRVVNNMLSIIVDPAACGDVGWMKSEVDRFVAWVKSSRPRDPAAPVLVAGEPERRARTERGRLGIPLDDETWRGIVDTGRGLGLDPAGWPAAPA